MTALSRIWLAGRRVASDILKRPLAAYLKTSGTGPGRYGAEAAVPHDLRAHQLAALSWLCVAQDATPDGGVSAGLHLKDSWLPSYPETTGYIACTFFDLVKTAGTETGRYVAQRTAEAAVPPDLAERAWRMIDWLLSCQLEDGAYPGQFGNRSQGPIVFNTGQILLGLVRAAEADPSRTDVQRAAQRAGAWLAAVMDEDGCWSRHTHAGLPHTYNTRTAWALLRCYQLWGDRELRQAAARNLHWALWRQHADGWFEQAGFRDGVPPYLHTIAYTIRGLLEGGCLLDDDELLDGAALSGRALAHRLVSNREDGRHGDRPLRGGSLAGAYDCGWQPVGRYRCLTGEAQMAIVWARLFEHTGESLFRAACDRAVRFVAAAQQLDGPAEVRGAIPGSVPIWGSYSRFEFPNWAAKFFVDAVAAHQRVTAATPTPVEESVCV